jgi:hypothetical protein
MSTLNLLPKKPAENAKIVKLRRIVYSFSTLALVINLVTVSAIGGWWFYLTGKSRVTAVQIQQLTSQVTALSQAEILARQIDSRSTIIKEVLTSRDNTPQMAGIIHDSAVDLAIEGWRYSPELGSNSITVLAVNSGSIETFAKNLAAKFPVSLSNFAKDESNTWLATVKILPLLP